MPKFERKTRNEIALDLFYAGYIGGQEGARQLRDISEQLEAALFTINSGQVLSESEVSA